MSCNFRVVRFEWVAPSAPCRIVSAAAGVAGMPGLVELGTRVRVQMDDRMGDRSAFRVRVCRTVGLEWERRCDCCSTHGSPRPSPTLDESLDWGTVSHKIHGSRELGARGFKVEIMVGFNVYPS